MTDRQRFWSWLVFVFSVGAYAPLAVGGWQHPREINVAAFAIWAFLAATFLYASKTQGFAGWRLPFGWLIGNVAMVILGLVRGGYTFNLGPAEYVALYGFTGTVGLWVLIGQLTGRWDARVLYLGSIASDIASFYPQIKQYVLPHEPPTTWMLVGWLMFLIGAAVNLLAVERFVAKLMAGASGYQARYGVRKKVASIFEESALSLENGAFILVTILVMTLT
ncbi:MAG: hypothetical protein PHT12_01345 [Patescibacteria group bacterium]|nr:hypothetical protein [Patescibacteria group bacterium]